MSKTCGRCGGRVVTLEASVRAPAHDSCQQCGDYIEHPCVIVQPGIPAVVQIVNGRGLSAAQLEKDRERQRQRRLRQQAEQRAGREMA